jgi:hypothetical protein
LKLNRRSSNGYALIVVLVLLAIGTTLGFLSLNSTNLQLTRNWLFRQRLTVKSAAERGFDFAKLDLQARGRALDFDSTQRVDKAPYQGFSTGVGLVPSSAGPSTPRIVMEKGDIRNEVWYFANESNTVYNSSLPKLFRVISYALDRKTGQNFTIEGDLTLRQVNFSEFAFGMLAPTAIKLDINTEFNFRPKVYGGRAHFGKFGKTQPDYYGKVRPTLNFEGASSGHVGSHIFKGHATFEDDLVPDYEYPFRKSSTAEVVFEEGYERSAKTKLLDLTQMDQFFDGLESEASSIFSHWKTLDASHLCLQFTADGRVERWQCSPNSIANGGVPVTALNRYIGSGPLETISLLEPVVIYVRDDVEVRGVYNSQVTLVSEKNIRIGGDIQDAEQGPYSPNRFGAIAQNDIVVPHYIPSHHGWTRWDENALKTEKALMQGKSNFVVSGDRDRVRCEGQDTCDYPQYWYKSQPEGSDNRVTILDLDGSILAFGKVDVEGINTYCFDGSMPDPSTGKCGVGQGVPNSGDDANGKGRVVPAVDGNMYFKCYDDTNPKCLYRDKVDIGNNTFELVRRAEPIYCYQEASPCPKALLQYQPNANCHYVNGVQVCGDWVIENGKENPRPVQEKIWTNGGIVTGNFWNTMTEDYQYNTWFMSGGFTGFEQTQVNFDRKLLVNSPPGFPASDQISLYEIWRKQYPGTPEKLKPLLAQAH